MTTIDDIFAEPRGRSGTGCRACGRPIEVSVDAHIRKADSSGRTMRGKGTVKSRTISLCGEHGAETYLKLLAVMDELVRR